MSTILQAEGAVVEAIYRLHESRTRRHRGYLGASELGRPCARALWYGFRSAEVVDFEGRLLRLFETGHREEARTVAELREAGYELHDRNPKTRRQFAISAFGGHFRGHLDGLIRGLPTAPTQWCLLELKTSNKKRFDAMARRGVAAEKPEHYAQMQIYMGFAAQHWGEWGVAGEPPRRALYLVVCKDDERMHAEVMPFDEEAFVELGQKAGDIITASEPPPRPWYDPEKWPCMWCDHVDVCHRGRVPVESCKNCIHITPRITDGTWVCERHGYEMPADAARTNICPDHLFISPLLERFGEVVDYDQAGKHIDWIEYADGEVRIRNTVASFPQDAGPTSTQLRKMANE